MIDSHSPLATEYSYNTCMNKIKDSFQFALVLGGSIILNAVAIGIVLGLPAYFLFLHTSCGE